MLQAGSSCFGWCDGVGFIVILTALVYLSAFHHFVIKPLLRGLWSKFGGNFRKPWRQLSKLAEANRWVELAPTLLTAVAGSKLVNYCYLVNYTILLLT